ncbi:phosphodiesterase [Salipiger aestuarii]|uniref:Glycerophosphoryl diester phosphodiesterase n=1 Tax=Salipiger aestuarii TaxID=568098 RepID=A0A327Y310_9RHOB|nr:glycerophosphodiester phosphodiesterase family protein [Salipiger aestuarii]EIE49752.1 phosphodiesterase-like protein [Citreicella sp. 357]KAA8607644.1 phosphodiesterase [Salipiger aestuarii]KAA8611105.1 phosphodiesterase [Salipiger aestuarii]KAB2541871.1 phosphodiesterase [Salipiger aestuarii]RAK15393.1 glycerophosphoryl diester phosphodiesterase [Salipiger aestuarii]
MQLPSAFLERPIAHRALHDSERGRPENSLSAISAAIQAGYGIEIDLQLSRDGEAMVFHDDDLSRLTTQTGPVRQHSAAELGAITLRHGHDPIPTLVQVLALVAGKAPLLIEIKDQDGAMGPNVGALETAAARALAGYIGPVAVMSFNPASVAAMARRAPGLPRGLTTCGWDAEDQPLVPEATRARLRGIPDYDAVGACFISHDKSDLSRPRVADLKRDGAAVLCWTVRSPEQETEARKIAQNITFEGYAA